MKGKENSMPLKKRMKMKWVKFRTRWEFVRVCFRVGGGFEGAPSSEDF